MSWEPRDHGRGGAVISVTQVKSAILAAELVHTKLKHSCLSGASADEICAYLGMDVADPEPATRSIADCVDEHRRQSSGGMFGTVGAVAIDANGVLAAGTSTSGYAAALPGRVGDSGALGVGTIASKYCAVSCTGDGDRFLLVGLAARLDAYLEVGLTLQGAAIRAMQTLGGVGALGGFIAVTAGGELLRARNLEILRSAGSGMFVEVIDEPPT